MVKRKAIAMIELIVAIVIMGIALLAIPVINNEAVKSGENAMLQESIAAGASQMQLILSKHWDEGDADPTLGAPILTTTSPRFTTYGGLNPASRTTLNTNNLAVAASNPLGAEGGDRDDIDDFDGTIIALLNVQNTTTIQGDYADTDIQMVTTVNYGSDAITDGVAMVYNGPFNAIAPTTTSNIKLVSTLVRHNPTNVTNIDSIDQKSIVLSAFSCNIGTATPNITGDN